MSAMTSAPEARVDQYIERFKMRSFLNDALIERLRLVRFPPYAAVYREQTVQDRLYFLVEGQLQCSHYHANGKLAVIAISKPFAAIGDVEILSDEPLRADVITTEGCVLLSLTRSDVQRFGSDDPRFLRFLIDQLRAKLYQSNAIQSGIVLPVASRLALYLLSNAELHTDAWRVAVPHKERLASLLGTTTRHLNRVLHDLSVSGTLAIEPTGVRVRNRTTLEMLAER